MLIVFILKLYILFEIKKKNFLVSVSLCFNFKIIYFPISHLFVFNTKPVSSIFMAKPGLSY